jgi:exodeoxyribonuclease-3
MIDSFRVFDQAPERYSWWSYRGGARSRNVGWRIDYHWVSKALKDNLRGAEILVDAVHSDHCPVTLELK